jgi:hypothetical protein
MTCLKHDTRYEIARLRLRELNSESHAESVKVQRQRHGQRHYDLFMCGAVTDLRGTSAEAAQAEPAAQRAPRSSPSPLSLAPLGSRSESGWARDYVHVSRHA